MSNTYARISKEVTTKGFMEYPSVTNNYELSLTAFVGGENHTQLTVQCRSTQRGQEGTGWIVLSDKDVDNLIAALLERKLGKISATGYEQSAYIPNDEPEMSEPDHEYPQ